MLRKRSGKRRTEFGNTIDGFSILGSSQIALVYHQTKPVVLHRVQVLFVNTDNITGCLTSNLLGSAGESEKDSHFSHNSEKPLSKMMIKKVNSVAVSFHERKWFLKYVSKLQDAPKHWF
jgi:hypothetical protein